MRPTRLLMLAGSLVWVLAGVAVARNLLVATDARAIVHAAAWLGFGLAFFANVVATRINFRASLALQTASSVALAWGPDRDTFGLALLVVVAGQLPAVFSFRASLGWIAAQTALAFLPGLRDAYLWSTVSSSLAYVAFQLFAVGAATLAENERLAREELARANNHLEALQQRLADTTREAERLRIARELHDALGHQLTALGLDLEIARHSVTGEAAAPVQRARVLASALMASLRETVTELREDAGRDLLTSLNGLARSDGSPRVEVLVQEGAGRCAPPVAFALLRVAQEIVTNATRHSGARTVRIALSLINETWQLQGTDDGSGRARVCEGFGLSGMRERVESLGGTLEIQTAPGHGFTVIATVPREVRA